MKVEVRRAIPSDAAEVTEIYNYSIVHERNSTFETEGKSVEDRKTWIEEAGQQYPIMVAVSENQVVGWASVSAYRQRDCYKGVGEFSIYLHKDFRGKGVGKQLLRALIEECERVGYWKLLSRIFEFNHASRQLCRSLGFREVGIYEKHGQLDGRWIDCVIVEKLLPQNMKE